MGDLKKKGTIDCLKSQTCRKDNVANTTEIYIEKTIYIFKKKKFMENCREG